MLQTIEGKDVYVVEFDTMPELPITFANEAERPYAVALSAAIHTGIITGPGKYGIGVKMDKDGPIWDVFEIKED
jgi:hypothetical protein